MPAYIPFMAANKSSPATKTQKLSRKRSSLMMSTRTSIYPGTEKERIGDREDPDKNKDLLENKDPPGKIGALGKICEIGKKGALGKIGKIGALGKIGEIGKIGALGKIGEIGKKGALLGKIGKKGALGKIGTTGLSTQTGMQLHT